MKDYVLIKHHLRASVLDTRVHHGGDLDTDRPLVVTALRLKLQKKKIPKTRNLFDVGLLEQTQTKAEYIDFIAYHYELKRVMIL